MRTLLSMLVTVVLLVSCNKSSSDESSEDKVPAAVEKSFKTSYPDIKDFTWEQEGEFKEVEFELNGVEISVLYDKDGKFIQKEIDFDVNQLPEGINIYIAENYPGAEIEEAETIESNEGNFFEVEIENVNDEEVELLFDVNGNFVEEVIETDEGEDDDDGKEDEGENEIEIEISELPSGVMEYINQNYDGYIIVEAEKETTEAEVFYEVELQRPDGEELDLVFDSEGNFVEIEVEE